MTLILCPGYRARYMFTIWANYPDAKPYIDEKTGKPPKGFENQCAIKVSVCTSQA